MKLSELPNDTKATVKDIIVEDKNIACRLQEIGIKIDAKIRMIKKSKISKCVLVETLGSVFVIDKNISEGIICYE